MIDAPLRHYILAGGRSRRFGRDKARAVIDDRAMIVRVAERFASVSISTVVVAGQADAYTDLGLHTIADSTPGAGPVAGLCAALQHAARFHHEHPFATSPRLRVAEGTGVGWVLLTSCDLVAADAGFVRPLLRLTGPGCSAAVYRHGGFFEPFPGLYRLDALATAEATLRSRRASMQAFLSRLGTALTTRPLPPGTPTPLDADRPGDLHRPGPCSAGMA